MKGVYTFAILMTLIVLVLTQFYFLIEEVILWNIEPIFILGLAIYVGLLYAGVIKPKE